MKVLLDECVPHPLKAYLSEFDVATAQEMGWASVKNGDLLRLAEKSFDVFVTLDRHLHEQQNLKSFNLAIVTLATSNRVEDLVPIIEAVKAAIRNARVGQPNLVSQ